MYYDLFGREPMDWHVVCLIKDMKKQFLAAGGDPIDFPDFLKAQGIEARSNLICIDDSFVTMAKLKFGHRS
jgi:hypothetical protein